jgi:hypothetical protein
VQAGPAARGLLLGPGLLLGVQQVAEGGDPLAAGGGPAAAGGAAPPGRVLQAARHRPEHLRGGEGGREEGGREGGRGGEGRGGREGRQGGEGRRGRSGRRGVQHGHDRQEDEKGDPPAVQCSAVQCAGWKAFAHLLVIGSLPKKTEGAAPERRPSRARLEGMVGGGGGSGGS